MDNQMMDSIGLKLMKYRDCNSPISNRSYECDGPLRGILAAYGNLVAGFNAYMSIQQM